MKVIGHKTYGTYVGTYLSLFKRQKLLFCLAESYGTEKKSLFKLSTHSSRMEV